MRRLRTPFAGAAMVKKVRRKTTQAPHTGGKHAETQRDKGWDERLRLVGDAGFTQVTWSGRDHPSWPLPRK
jgi:hypothetical protein